MTDQSTQAADSESLLNKLQSRSTGLPTRLGKSTEKIAASVPPVVKEDLIRMCSELDMDESQFVRLVVMEKIYGAEQVRMMMQERTAALFGN